MTEPVDLASGFSLGQEGRPGTTLRYLVRRENRTLDRQGRTAGWTVAEGVVARTLLEELEPGIWRERFEWTRYAFAEAQGMEERPEPVDRPEVAGTAFEAVPRTSDHGQLPEVETGAAGKDNAMMILGIMGLDALTWDGMMGLLLADLGDRAHLGARAERAAEPEALELGTGMRYRIGATEVEVAGVTRVDAEPALLVSFQVDGARLEHQAEVGAMSLDIRGTEFFAGQATFSLDDGRLLEGELWGPVISRTELTPAGAEPRELPVGGTLQRVWMREIGG